MSQPQRLRDLLATGTIISAPGAPDSLAARLVEQAGFPAIYMTGFGATASRLGRPDIGLLTQTEMTTHARDMTISVRDFGCSIFMSVRIRQGVPSASGAAR